MAKMTDYKTAQEQAQEELAQSVFNKQRSDLIAAEARIAAQEVVDAKARMERSQSLARDFNADDAAIQRSVVARVAAALASEHVVPTMDVAPDMQMTAWTDFETIFVRYRPFSDVPLFCATLRGLMYHEGGHIRWTTTFEMLRTLATGGPTDLTGVDLQRLHRSWNSLEDQRMETAVTSDSPRKAAFFTPLIMMELAETPEMACANWPLFIWRRYLPKHIRDGARALFVQANNEWLARDMEVVVDRYVKAADAKTMWEAVLLFADLLDKAHTAPKSGGGSGKHTDQDSGSSNKNSPSQIPIDPTQDMDAGEGAGDDASKGDTEGDGASAGKGKSDAKGGDKGQDSQGGDDGKDESKGKGKGQGSGEGDHSPRPLDQRDLWDALDEAQDAVKQDSSVINDTESFLDAKDNAASCLPPYKCRKWDDADPAVLVAQNLADDIVQAFSAATMDRQPGWIQGQRSGVLNVGRYITRQPGDMEVFDRWDDDDQPGLNLAVSVLLDYSGSMGPWVKELSQVGYACKLACARLDVPCSVVLWDTGAVSMFDANDVPDGMPIVVSAGGTQPHKALSDLDNQRFGKARHLVIMMTDGQFGGNIVSTYTDPGRNILGVAFSKTQQSADAMAKSLQDNGCRDAFGTTDLFTIPRALELMLIDMG